MATNANIPSQPSPAAASGSASDNPAVARCLLAYERARQEVKDQGKNHVYETYNGNKAFRKAMPPLIGYENICDFIACVAHGMLIGIISGSDGARLLYASQVAQTTIRKQPAAPKSAAA